MWREKEKETEKVVAAGGGEGEHMGKAIELQMGNTFYTKIF